MSWDEELTCSECKITSYYKTTNEECYCNYCGEAIEAPVTKVSDLETKQVGYIHLCSKSKEIEPPIGQYFVLIDKKDGKYGILLNGRHFIVSEEWANDHYITTHRCLVYSKEYETDINKIFSLQRHHSLSTYRNAYWDDEPSVNYPLADIEDGYISLHTGGGWSCGVPYGAYISKDDGRVDRQINAILVCKTEHDAFNINYIVNKKDAQP